MRGLAFMGRGPSSDLVFLGLKLNLCFRSFKVDEPCHGDRLIVVPIAGVCDGGAVPSVPARGAWQ